MWLSPKYHLITNFPRRYPTYKKIFANIVYFISGIVIHKRRNLLSHKDLLKARMLLRKGDILLVGNLRELSHLFITGPLTHALIYIGGRKFVHAIADGVQYTTLHHLFTEYDTMIILRLPKSVPFRKKKIMAAIKHAEEQIGKPYDFDFTSDKNKFFCTELVNSAYTHAGHDTGLHTMEQFRTFKEKIEKVVISAIKALHPEKFIEGNFDIIFMSHNIELKRKIQFKVH
ncbi:MAG: YiiX/YebB-like N1pC/P60 family cysteine hydrolase [Candidatus Woesearchaeota archaeon]